MKKKIWIDCDPGIDDAVAIAMIASAKDQLQLLGISTVAGNMNSMIVNHNALGLSKLLNLDVPIIKGANNPFLKPLEDASEVHGQTGLGTVQLEIDENKPVYNLYKMYEIITAEKNVTLVATGPLTNIALLFKVFPDVIDSIDQLVIMGGSTIGGNVTPYAEFNMYTDPHCAKFVFTLDLPIVVCPLDLTSTYGINPKQINRLMNHSNPIANLYGKMLEGFFQADFYEGSEFVAVHDASTILYLLYPERYSGIQAGLDIVIEGKNIGETTLNTTNDNILLLNHIDDPDQMIETLLTRLESL